MAPAKKRDLNPTGLGRAIINRKSKDARQARESDLYTTDVDSSSRLRSVTQEKDLDEFLNTAQLAATDFTAERHNITIIQTPSATASSAHNSFLLTDTEEKQALEKHRENKSRLRVPRRPPWTRGVAHAQLERQERDAFLEWRRGLAQLQDEMSLLLTPFELNLEVWRQLWRVVERSHLVIQIVDARNPLRFRCEDLEAYVRDVEGPEGEHGTGAGKRKTLLLINKSDLLTARQRRMWADYFDQQNVQYAFFSAANAVAIQEARKAALLKEQEAYIATGQEEGDGEQEGDGQVDKQKSEEMDYFDSARQGSSSPTTQTGSTPEDSGSDSDESSNGVYLSADEHTKDGQDPRTRVLSVLELEALFEHAAPDLSLFADASGKPPSKLVVGLVGYPNVGKSSTINSLLGEKKVSVSSTPGKTKHFQTIQLSPSIVLCDCPGLVFPQFATTAADLVCDGVLPIDQLREYTGPVSLLTRRIPREFFEAIYGLTIRVKGAEEGGDGRITAEDLLIAYAIARGYARAGQGNPDEARAARYILKDYVNAKLLYCHPPPDISDQDFNKETQELTLRRLLRKKRAPVTRVTKNADTFISIGEPNDGQPAQSNKARAVDESFFLSGSNLSARPFVQGTVRHGQQFTRSKLYPHQNAILDDGTPLDGRRARIASVLATNGGEVGSKGKKHFKGNKRVKHRSGKGYD